MIIIVIVYIVLSIALAFYGKGRTIGFITTLVICIFFTPIIGFLFVVNSSKLILYHIVQHECPECGYSFDNKHDACPLCLKEDKYITLNSNIVPTT